MENNKQEIIEVLTAMIDYDYGYPAYDERWALKEAIKSLAVVPELLEACKFAHEYIQRREKFATPTMAVEYMAVERSLSDAIQKAEGAK